MVAESMPRVGVDFDAGALSQIARGLGGRGAQVSNAEGLAEALDAAMNFNGPTVIEIPDAALKAWA
jgi:thiamine pyrophosphate-dependent acetolactate synthase large subunit-like protein